MKVKEIYAIVSGFWIEFKTRTTDKIQQKRNKDDP